MAYYVVKRGREPGIYRSWTTCKEQIHKYSGAEFKKFLKEEDALKYYKDEQEDKEVIQVDERSICKIYVDGSFVSGINKYGCGIVILPPNSNQELKFMTSGSNEKYLPARNVAGEIVATCQGIKKAIELGFRYLEIYYDYKGIEMWANGKWKANSDISKDYKKFMDKLREDYNLLSINFVKVVAHSGNKYNEMADDLARRALTI